MGKVEFRERYVKRILLECGGVSDSVRYASAGAVG
jgi:hypothetical protein